MGFPHFRSSLHTAGGTASQVLQSLPCLFGKSRLLHIAELLPFPGFWDILDSWQKKTPAKTGV